jgi:Arc/MetJ-type ribon-helix-helix transcriptional regulator
MQRGFTDFVATRIIPDHPGHTALWYASEYLKLVDGSDLVARNPVQSLANTLSKQVQTGREKRVRRERIKGIFCFFPVSEASTLDSSEDIIVQFSLSTQELEDIDNLVAVGKFANRNDAIKWLVIEGIKSNRNYLKKAAQIKKQIEQLKREI